MTVPPCTLNSALNLAVSIFNFWVRAASGEGNGNPLQCSCLENPRDGGASWAAIYGVRSEEVV